ncbi:MAG TPA: DUF5908 family protein [Saprospiraceae bacterium]|nr:DUF5908 family protein [Saprospiraceae bacterium]HMQ82144.1 DUF5908 family protein [Saprospiraceae bacterium]
MPVEILELIIRAEVQSNHAEGGASASGDTNASADSALSQLDVVEQVHEILKRKKER